MHSDTLKATDDYSANKSTHPRVSLADMEGKVAIEEYFILGDKLDVGYHAGISCMTICVLAMTNGFVIVGKSAPASPDNFDPEKGKRFAYEDAIKQLWPLEGYALREKLSA